MKIKKLEVGIAKGMVEIVDDSVLSTYASINGDLDFTGYGEIDGKLWRFKEGWGDYVGEIDELSKLFSPNSKRFELDRRKTEALETLAKNYIKNAPISDFSDELSEMIMNMKCGKFLTEEDVSEMIDKAIRRTRFLREDTVRRIVKEEISKANEVGSNVTHAFADKDDAYRLFRKLKDEGAKVEIEEGYAFTTVTQYKEV